MLERFVIAVLAGVAVWLIKSFATRFRMDGLRRVRILEPKEHDQRNTNPAFYDYFCQQIDKATGEIVVTGEGFDFKTPESSKRAVSYHQAIRRAIERGVKVVRVQTARPLKRQWAELLCELIKVSRSSSDFGEFQLHVVDNKDTQEIASVCVIDAHLHRKNVVEFMLSVEEDLLDDSSRVAGTAVFLHGREQLAKAMRDSISKLINSESSTTCSTKEQLDKFVESQKDE